MRLIIRIERCLVCQQRPRARSSTLMCVHCLANMINPSLIDLDRFLDYWYGHHAARK